MSTRLDDETKMRCGIKRKASKKDYDCPDKKRKLGTSNEKLKSWRDQAALQQDVARTLRNWSNTAMTGGTNHIEKDGYTQTQGDHTDQDESYNLVRWLDDVKTGGPWFSCNPGPNHLFCAGSEWRFNFQEMAGAIAYSDAFEHMTERAVDSCA